MTNRLMSAATNANAAATRIAVWYPVTVATRGSSVSAFVAAVVATPDKIAKPIAPPIYCEVFSNPDASPASCFATPEVAAIEIEMNVNPAPNAIVMIPGKTTVK